MAAAFAWFQVMPVGEIEVTADWPDIPSGPSNTVYRASRLFMDAVDAKKGLHVFINKQIPHSAGLGGGSSDAAGMLTALNYIFGRPLSLADLITLAAQVGSDVPYFFAGGTAHISGRGDVVQKLPDAPKMDIVIVKPEIGISTEWAYKKLDDGKRRKSSAPTAAVAAAVRREDRVGVLMHMSNDFQDIVSAEHPEIKEIKQDMIGLGSEKCLLCGSGAAVFGVFAGQEEANSAARSLAEKYPFASAASTCGRAIEIIDLE